MIDRTERKRDTDYVFHELTRSICPECKKVIDAQVLLRDNKVYMRKRCPEHGWVEGLGWGGVGCLCVIRSRRGGSARGQAAMCCATEDIVAGRRATPCPPIVVACAVPKHVDVSCRPFPSRAR